MKATIHPNLPLPINDDQNCFVSSLEELAYANEKLSLIRWNTFNLIKSLTV